MSLNSEGRLLDDEDVAGPEVSAPSASSLLAAGGGRAAVSLALDVVGVTPQLAFAAATSASAAATLATLGRRRLGLDLT